MIENVPRGAISVVQLLGFAEISFGLRFERLLSRFQAFFRYERNREIRFSKFFIENLRCSNTRKYQKIGKSENAEMYSNASNHHYWT